MVPGVGHDAGTVDGAPFAHGIAVENLLGRDRKDCRHEGDQPGPGQHSAVEHRPDGPDAVDEDSDAHDSQRHADEDRGQGFVLAVTVVVPVVPGLGRDPREDDHDDIGRQVGERMHGIGDHRAASPEDAGGEFSERQHEIDRETDEGHAVNASFPDFCGV